MLKKVDAIKRILKIPVMRLPSPRILFTLDSKEPNYDTEIGPILSVFSDLHIPVTIFMTNMTLSGKENYPAITKILQFSEGHHFPVEIASHGLQHHDLSVLEMSVTIEKINGSLKDFSMKGLSVHGFRAPFFSTENSYRDILDAMAGNPGNLRYDSSICFESNLLTSAFNLLVGKKCPHRIGNLYELPISALDDYHILSRMGRGDRFSYLYWKVEALMWIRRLNYCMFLFHPHIIGKKLALLKKFLSYCHDRFPSDAFITCSELIRELDLLNYVHQPSEVR